MGDLGSISSMVNVDVYAFSLLYVSSPNYMRALHNLKYSVALYIAAVEFIGDIYICCPTFSKEFCHKH